MAWRQYGVQYLSILSFPYDRTLNVACHHLWCHSEMSAMRYLKVQAPTPLLSLAETPGLYQTPLEPHIKCQQPPPETQVAAVD